MSQDGVLLNELCSICHANPPKYRCPRDSARTCSLECSKRHKQRADCSGKRDPAAKVSKSQLYTAEGIDNDYNFISHIERSLGKKDREDEERLESRKRTRRGELVHPKKGNQAYQRRLEETGVVIDHAPKGMTRQRSNRTRWNDRENCIVWSVEWVHDNGEKDVRDQKDSESLSNAYVSRFGGRHKVTLKKPEMHHSDPEQLLTRKQTVTEDERSANYHTPQSPGHREDPCTALATSSSNDQNRKPSSAQDQGTKHDEPSEVKVSLSSEPSKHEERPPSQSSKLLSVTTSSTIPKSRKTYYYYLLKTRLPTSEKVLISLPSDTSLFHCLRNQVVLEYPTIYALEQAPDALPEGFRTEEAYLKEFKMEQAELEEMLKEVGPLPRREGMLGQKAKGDDEEMNADRVMEVLKKDLDAIR